MTILVMMLFKVTLTKQIAARSIGYWISYVVLFGVFLTLPTTISLIELNNGGFAIGAIILLLGFYWRAIKSEEKNMCEEYQEKVQTFFIVKGSAKFTMWGAIPFFEELERVVHFTLLYLLTDNVYVSLLLTAVIFALQHSNWAEVLVEKKWNNLLVYFIISVILTACMYWFGFVIAVVLHSLQNFMTNYNTKKMRKVYHVMREKKLPHIVILQTGDGINSYKRFIDGEI